MRQQLSCVLDISTKDTLKAWLGNFRHCEDIYVDIDEYRVEFMTMDDRGISQRMTMPNVYLKCECRIKDLLGEENE